MYVMINFYEMINFNVIIFFLSLLILFSIVLSQFPVALSDCSSIHNMPCFVTYMQLCLEDIG